MRPTLTKQERARAYQREYRKKPEFKQRRKEYYARPEVQERLKEYYARPEVQERLKEYYARPEVKKHRQEYYARPEVRKRIRQYYARPEVKARFATQNLRWSRHYYTLCRILALERLWDGEQYEFPFNFAGDVPSQNMSDLLNGQRTLFVSNGNGHFKGIGACYEALDDSRQDVLNEVRELQHTVAELKAGKHAAKYKIRPKRPPLEPKPAPERRYFYAPPPLTLRCPICGALFNLPAAIVNRLRTTGEHFTCPNGDLLCL
jgi:hypothetical protein